MIWQKLHLLIKSESAHTELGSIGHRGKGKPRTWIVWVMWSRRRQARACDLGSNGRWPSKARGNQANSLSASVCALVIFIYPLFICFGCLSFILLLIYFNHILHIYELHWKLWWTQKNFIWIFWLAEKFLTNITYTWVVRLYPPHSEKCFCGVIQRETLDRC